MSIVILLEVDDLEKENAQKDKELAKLNKAISKSKSKKETQALVEELISFQTPSCSRSSFSRGSQG